MRNLILCLVLYSCASDRFVKSELYFGLSVPKGGKVDHEDWKFFLDTAISPRFPAGFTVLEGEGLWRDTLTGQAVEEPAKKVEILYPKKQARAAAKSLSQIQKSYCRVFSQQAVMRVEYRVKVSFR